ncbi:MAG: glycoside hydrolase family 43 protein [Deltaproteobacteria bacterium]|jgi:beta-xylosidase|nr:glycoside hydrolase family 43 protein [Deltaproteobacteria bacterium]
MNKQRNKIFFPGAGVLCLLATLVLAATVARTGKTYTNPVLVETVVIKREQPDNFSGVLGIGDPAVLSHEGKYYLYPTGDNHGYDVYISTDLVNWRKGHRVFQSEEPGVWAPDVFYNDTDRKFYLYYTVKGRIGVAVADQPDSIFKDRGTLIENGIDAHMFRDDDNRYYLYYVQYPGFIIHVQPMASPLQKKGDPVRIIQATDPWEQKQSALTEAPWMLKHLGVYYLLYSGGGADSQDYAIGYATAKSPVGPFTKYNGNPIIKKDGNIFGPGHCAVVKTGDGQLWMVYHQQKNGSRGWNRIICIDPLWFDEKGVLHGRATRGVSRPVPGQT